MMIKSLTIAQAQPLEKLTELRIITLLHTLMSPKKYGEHFSALMLLVKMKLKILAFGMSFRILPRPLLTISLKFSMILILFAKKAVVNLILIKYCTSSRTLCLINMKLKNPFVNFLLNTEEVSFLILFELERFICRSMQIYIYSQLTRMNNFFCGLHYLVALQILLKQKEEAG